MKVGQLIDILNDIPSDLEIYLNTMESTFNKSLGSVTSERVYGYVDTLASLSGGDGELKSKNIVVLGQRPIEPTGGD